MRLLWCNRTFEGRTIESSITDNEKARLEELAERGLVLEIGSAYGYTTCLLARVATYVTAIDPHAGYGSMPNSWNIINQNISALDLKNITLHVNRSDNMLPSMIREGRHFDLVFVDGDHRMDAAYYDVRHAWQLVGPGGALAVHDYGEETCPQVIPAVDKFLLELTDDVTVDVVDTLCTVVR